LNEVEIMTSSGKMLINAIGIKKPTMPANFRVRVDSIVFGKVMG
jgi:hypothetical protein